MSQGLKTFYSALLWKNITVSLLFMKVLGILCISLFYPWCIHLELADKGYFFTHYSDTVPRRNVLSAVSAVFSSCG